MFNLKAFWKSLFIVQPKPEPIVQTPPTPIPAPVRVKTPFDWAKGELGVSENNAPKRVIEYHQATTLGADDTDTPWCSSFVNWCFKMTGDTTRTKDAWARSWLSVGKKIKLSEAKPGDVLIFERGENFGHVGFFWQYLPKDDLVSVLGGNQDNCVKLKLYARSRLLGVRRFSWNEAGPE